MRLLEPLGHCQQLPVAMVIEDCSHWDLAGSARRFRGRIYRVPRAASSPELGGGSVGYIISFPDILTDKSVEEILDSFVHFVHSVQSSRHGGCYYHRGDIEYHSVGELNALGILEISCP